MAVDRAVFKGDRHRFLSPRPVIPTVLPLPRRERDIWENDGGGDMNLRPWWPFAVAAVAVVVLASGVLLGGCPFGHRKPLTSSSAIVVEGQLAPSPVPVGTPHTMSVTVTNRGDGPIHVTGVDVTRSLPDGRTSPFRVGGWDGGLRASVVPAGETVTVWSRSGRNCGNAGNYNVYVIVHTDAGDFTDSFSYEFTA